jgi:hypothetical protein
MTLLLRVFDNKVSTPYKHTNLFISMLRSVAIAVYSDWLFSMPCSQCLASRALLSTQWTAHCCSRSVLKVLLLLSLLLSLLLLLLLINSMQ